LNQVWLYPGDRLVSRPRIVAFVSPPDHLELRGMVATDGDPATPIHVRLTVGDRVLLDTDVPLSEWLTGTTLPLPGPLPTELKDVVLTLSSAPDAPWLILSSVRLFERRLESAP